MPATALPALDALNAGPDAGPGVLVFAIAVMLAAGIVKGAIGFALPLLFLGGLSLVLPIQTVVALIAIPALASNGLQAFRTGLPALLATLREFWLLNSILFATTLVCTGLVVRLPEQRLVLILGLGAFLLALLQAFEWPRGIPRRWRQVLEVPYGLVAGFFGGLSGLWGTALLTYFLALRLPKEAFVRTIGVAWLVATVPYVAGHASSGVLSRELLPWSVAALAPTLCGLWIGRRIQDRLDSTGFRRLVLAVLLLATLNLVRRGLWG